ncbi:hydroxyethylthiazole kinase [Palleronia aestuarii]|uniref:Hydroxyethylthiazole kinase n=1 Tax=Palleronia aestuarii TaxID=568105 RepID=A0A2W7NJY6_9RHOB|nr:hydroxyethylthiazole kinase [Palleronia aestuarii]PZX17014.1 hydroxyethylthiazole kinase [Palleronia aestuarii]
MDDPSRHLERVRRDAPLVQYITNYVAMNVAANVLLAAGASPAMVHAREEAPGFAAMADALAINIGTIDGRTAEAMPLAAAAARAAGTPWVFDPVAVGATAFRQETARGLLAERPCVIRGNASEIRALAGLESQGRGADASDAVAAAEDAARALAGRTGAVVAVTGPVDFVTDGERAARVANGHPLMPRVTALGCALTGLVAAFVAGGPRFEATLAALACFGVAGEIAAEGARGPGSLQVNLLDALHAMEPGTLDARARIDPA